MAVMYKQEGGVPALYRGIIPTIAGVAPYVSFNMRLTGVICLIWHEKTNGFLGRAEFHDI